jgi:hypothetical protein
LGNERGQGMVGPERQAGKRAKDLEVEARTRIDGAH